MATDEKVINIIKSALDNETNKIVNENIKQTLKYKPATVIGYDSDTYIASVTFLDSEEIYTYYNKTGCELTEGDNVKIQYTVNPAKGDLTIKCGQNVIEKNENGIPAIVSIQVNDNFDFNLNTNSGTERYIAVVE